MTKYICILIFPIIGGMYSSCKSDKYKSEQPSLSKVLNTYNVSAYSFNYTGTEEYYTIADLLEMEYLELDKVNRISLSELISFFKDETNFYKSKADCSTFLVTKGIVLMKNNEVVQLVFESCSGSKLIIVENGIMKSYYLTAKGIDHYQVLINVVE